MRYQLVLRFRKAAFDTPAAVHALERELTEALGGKAQLDGHDTGQRDIDLFMVSEEPDSAFRRCKPALEKLSLLDKVVVAHRLEGGARFKVLWPLKYGRKFTLS